MPLHLQANRLGNMKKYLKRHIDQELLQWAETPKRKPLLLRGARQVDIQFLIFQTSKWDDFNSVRASIRHAAPGHYNHQVWFA